MVAPPGFARLPVPDGPMSARAIGVLTRRLREIDLDPEIEVVGLRGTDAGFGGVLELGEESARAFVDLLCTVRDLPKPVIAVVEVEARAEGMALAAACDFTLAASGARFRARGRRGPPVGTAILIRVLGRARALELLLTGRTLEAAQAQDAGLVALHVPDDKLEDAFAAAVGAIVREGPSAAALTKRSILGDASRLRPDLEQDARVRAVAHAAPLPPSQAASGPTDADG